MSEPEARDAAATTRSQNVVHLHDRNYADAARLLANTLDRPGGSEGTTTLVIVPTTNDALRVAEARARTRAAGGALLTPITGVARGRRLVPGRPAIVGAPSELLPLVRESRLPLAQLETAVLVWPEEVIGTGVESLESLLAEVPRTADRIALVARGAPALDEFLDRVMWRARRVDHATRDSTRPTALRFVVIGPGQRLHAVQVILDALDPDTTALVALADDEEADARMIAAALGAGEDDPAVIVSRGVPGAVTLAVVFDVPAPETLAEIAGRAQSIVAIVDPTRVGALRGATGGAALPLVVTDALRSARSALDAVREAVRGAITAGAHTPWMPVVEPLLGDLDPVEVAAAAMALFDRERRKSEARKADTRAAGREDRAALASAPPRRSRGGEPGVERSPDRRERRERGDDRPHRRERDGDRPRGRFGRESGRGRDDSRPPNRGDAGARRREPSERVPRAARERDEWAARGERLRHSRRGRPGRDNE